MKLNIDLTNCYGISELVHCFDFNASNGYAIYAPNGFMKTSLAKTFDDHAKGRASVDVIFSDRESRRTITNDDGASVEADSIFVIEPYNPQFASERTSLLLVNAEIKKSYDEAHLRISETLAVLLTKLKQLSGLTGRTSTPESELLKAFASANIHDLLESLEKQVGAEAPGDLATVIYAELFNEKTMALLESGAIKGQLEEYIGRYNELVSTSAVLSTKFNHYNAGAVNRHLSDNGFFSAKHTINLNVKGERIEISSSEELAKRLDEERKRIFSDEKLSANFDAIDKKIQNAELRRFRDYLFDNQGLLPRLKDYQQLQKDIWLSYLAAQKELFDHFLKEYTTGKVAIEAAVAQAKAERTRWEDVVATFNRRFFVPFTMSVANQEDVILKGSKPSIAFRFADGEREDGVNADSLLKVLSQGERRALYILNILFELQSRQNQGGVTVLVVDDIADSFDYKNKYAIIEYLKDMNDSGHFFSIFLSHNFDFYRSISGRLNLKRESRLMASKSGRRLTLGQEKYQKNPFMHWRDNLDQSSCCISCIPFVRNLAEYCGLHQEYSTLTSLLHVKADTQTITLGHLCTIFKKVLVDKPALVLGPDDKLVLALVSEEAARIAEGADEHIDLEGKIVLSIAIRLTAENHMISRINDEAFVNSISSNQTIALLKRYKQQTLGNANEIATLEQVNLMTPENIHLNSFMYEPILDMGSSHLRSLYREVMALA